MNNLLLTNKPYTIDRIFRLFISVLLLLGLLWLTHYLQAVLLPFALAFLLAYILNPTVNVVTKYVKHRAIALIVTLSAIVILCIGTLVVLTPIIGKQMVSTANTLERVIVQNNIPASVGALIPTSILTELQITISETNVQQILRSGDALSIIRTGVNAVAPKIAQVFSGASFLVSLFATLVVISLYLFFLLLDFEKNSQDVTALIPKEYRKTILEFFTEFNTAMSRYFRGQTLISLCTGILFAIGFSIIGVPLAILIGLFAGALNMVPYLQIAAVPLVLLLSTVQVIETGGSIATNLIFVVIVFGVVQLIQDAILTPRILGKSTGLSPVFILLALSIWGKLFGLLGLIIAIPMTMLVLESYKRLLKSKQEGE
jgi:predicted PurR-regulated permease PerM